MNIFIIMSRVLFLIALFKANQGTAMLLAFNLTWKKTQQ